MKHSIKLIIGFLVALIGFSFLFIQLHSNEKPSTSTTQKTVSTTKKTIRYVALGDSLTEGVGDEMKKGGFVSIVSDNLKQTFNVKKVEVENAGIAGQRSDQILKRVDTDSSLQKQLKDADLITLTVGGNDLMKVIRANFMKLSIPIFDQASIDYEKKVSDLIKKLRALNAKAPIYVLGVYNPFYLNFSNIKEFQTIVSKWNQTTENVLKDTKNTHFIPINDLLYKGIDPENTNEATQTTPSDSSDSAHLVENDALSQEDKFHPNNTGYRIIAKAVKDELEKTKKEWLLEE